MDPAEYRRLLRTPEWKEFRRFVLELDGHECARCGQTNPPMHVHHSEYKSGKLPWEYAISSMETLCAGCHAQEHGIIMPDQGWLLVRDEDLEEVVGECGVCREPLRYVFYLYHPDWATIVGVGTDCCDRMTEPIAAALRRNAERRERFVRSSRWRGRPPHCSIDGFRVALYQRQNGTQVSISRGNAWIMGRVMHANDDDAKRAAFDAVVDGYAERLLSKR